MVREWLGPLTFSHGKVSIQREITVDSGWQAGRLDVVGFVQNTASGEILQALSSASCPAFN